MAHTVTLGGPQLQRVLDLTLAENERLMDEYNHLRAEMQAQKVEIQTLREEAQTLEQATQMRVQTFEEVNDASRLDDEARDERHSTEALAVNTLKTESEALSIDHWSSVEDHLQSGNQNARPKTPGRQVQAKESEQAPHSCHSTKVQHSARRERSVKRESIEIESDDDTTLPQPKRARPVSAEVEISDQPHLHHSTIATTDEQPRPLGDSNVVRSGVADSATPEDRRTEEASAMLAEDEAFSTHQSVEISDVGVLAFDNRGDTYILAKEAEPCGLRALISQTEESVASGFRKCWSKQLKKHSSWHSLVKSTTGCIRQVSRNDHTTPAVEGRMHTTCRRCFDLQLPYMRFDIQNPSRGIYVVPLPPSGRAGLGLKEIGYYIYPRPDAHQELETAPIIWKTRAN
ncbi:hypothetical protein LTR27_002699 [Elasticomyces elasticus]|nr:hypothetical protein LTR27_002699 [Elasticomyces elasticus]